MVIRRPAIGSPEFLTKAPRVDPDRAPRDLRPFTHHLGSSHPGRRAPRALAELLPSPPGGVMRTAASGDLRVAILRVDFLADGAGNLTTGNGRFDLRRGVSGIPVDPPPHDRTFFEAHGEALRRFYEVQSYGSLHIVPTVFPTHPDSAFHLRDTADYGPWEVSQNPDVAALAERFVTDALVAVDSHPEDVPFADFDAFVIVHAGTDFQGDVNRDTPFDVPSFTLELGESVAVDGGAVRIGGALVLPETTSQDDRIAALNGVFAHEFGHILGLVDLYNIYNGVPQVGYWSLMDSGENISAIVADPESGDEFLADGIFPTSLDPWSRFQIFPGAVAPIVVEERWEGDLEAVERSPYLPVAVVDGIEYFLVENRALDLDGNGFPFVEQDSTTGVFLGPVDDPDRPGTGGHLEYDAVLPGGGMLVWHIDDRLAVPGLESGAVNYQTGLRGVAVEEADGISDQGRFNFGTPFDPYFVGNHTKLGPATVPSSAANDDAYTGITIETTSPPLAVMHVRIERDLALGAWPIAFTQSDEERRRTGPVTLADLSGDGIPELVFGFELTRTGLPTIRTLGTIPLDGSSNVQTYVDLNNRLRPGLAASDSFRTAPADPGRTVVAGTLTDGQVYLWDQDGLDLLQNRGRVNATTAPVLWPPAGAPGVVLAAGIGTFAVLDPAGVGDRIDSSQVAPAAIPTAGPTLVPGTAGTAIESDLAAVAFEGGVVEFFIPATVVSASVPTPFTLASTVRSLLSGWVVSEESGPSLVAVTEDSVYVLVPARNEVTARWALPRGLALPPMLGDLDQDSRAEIVAADTTGRIYVWNGDGSPALGWPKDFSAPIRDLELADLDGDGGLDLLALDAPGRFQGVNGRGEQIPDYPRALGPYDVEEGTVARVDRAGAAAPGGPPVELLWLASAGLAVLPALELGKDTDLAVEVGEWVHSGGGRGRGHLLAEPRTPTPSAVAPVLDQPLFVYPNPARDWVELRFLLQEGEGASLEVLDLAGRPVEEAQLDQRGGYRAGKMRCAGSWRASPRASSSAGWSGRVPRGPGWTSPGWSCSDEPRPSRKPNPVPGVNQSVKESMGSTWRGMSWVSAVCLVGALHPSPGSAGPQGTVGDPGHATGAMAWVAELRAPTARFGLDAGAGDLALRAQDAVPADADPKSPPPSPLLAGVLSALIPGSGQLLQGDQRGWVYLGVEVAAWWSYLAVHAAGAQSEEDYRQFADASWDWQRYESVTDCGSGLGPVNYDEEHAALEEAYQSSPEQYYQDIADQDVYACGWEEQSQRAAYRSMIEESDQLYSAATWVVGAVVLNHAVSAIDAAKSAAGKRKSWMQSLQVAPTPDGLRVELARSF